MIFLSYSNKEYAFAESLVRTLNNDAPHLDLWFAPQSLDEGHDWFREITLAVQNDTCTSLILVASEAALASIWVAYEWKTIWDAGKPIYIVLFEPVSTAPRTIDFEFDTKDVQSDKYPLYRVIKCLEPNFSIPADKDDGLRHTIKLNLPIDQLFEQAVAVIDFRQQFSANVKRLIACIQGNEVVKDVVPKPNRFRFPLRTTLQVRLIVVSLIVPGVIFVLLALPLALTGAILGDGGTSVMAFLLTIMGFGMFYRAWNFLRREETYIDALPHLGLRQYLIPGIFMLPVIGFLAYRSATRPADNVYRWMPRDAVLPYQRRSRDKSAVTLQALRDNFPEPKYQLVYAPEDRRIGNRVRKSLVKLGYVEADDDSENFAFYIIILSNKTSISDVRRLNVSGKRVLAIVASSIALPRHVDEIVHYQWIDYRTHPSDLAKFIARSEPTVPIRPTSLRAPSFSCLFQAMLFNGTILVAAAVAILFYPSLVEEISPDCVWCEIVFPGLAGIIFLTLVSRILQRRVSAEMFSLFIVLAWLFGMLLIFSFSYVMGVEDATTSDLSSLVAMYYFFVFPLIVVYYGRRLFRWLPAFSYNRQRDDTIAVPYTGQIWRVSLVFVMMATLIFLCRIANQA